MNFDAENNVQIITDWIKETVFFKLKKKGAVIGISGGIDSSVVAALCARALGPERVIGVALPEKDSSPMSVKLARDLAESLKIRMMVEDITAGLLGMGVYRRRDEAIVKVFPEYKSGNDFKITLQTRPLEGLQLNVFQGEYVNQSGQSYSKRLPLKEYLQIVAASNMKQRLRMTMLYYHAELNNYIVAGTGNKNEHDLGFFVKYGDGGADIKPIVKILKTNVYEMAKVLEIPSEIISRVPTTDTYPGDVTQEEFFFRLPFHIMDNIWDQYESGAAVEVISQKMNMSVEQITSVINDIIQKRQATEYLRSEPLEPED